MRHLALPFYCAVIVGLLLALLARAIYTGAASFLLPFGAGVVFFTWSGVRDLRRNWPAFRKEMQQRQETRRREGWKPPPARNPGPPSAPVCHDDTH
ncbi:hypothetical protein [Stenotrophomonas sp. PA-6-5C]|uniref:hypothetical protein n=1 Tax=Stenotrophomonas sp. PA-6-5C TaxID=2665487 RepID=UPI001F3F9FBA|nr:hypothetical protein [Stenotrophomonas sp. PA-6-5C]